MKSLSEKLIRFIATYVVEYRNQLDSSAYRPGTSEYLDLLNVIAEKKIELQLTDEQLEHVVDEMGDFLVKKSFAADSIS